MSSDTTDLPNLTTWLDRATRYGTDPETLGAELIAMVREGIESHPRSMQKEIGPSELGHPCNRWLAHRLAGTPATGEQKPPWRPAVGTAVHDHFSLWCHQWNERYGVRYLTDLKVMVGELYPGRPITGRLDALDLETATVIDLKVPGVTAMKTYAAGKPESPQYEVQVDCYGAGAVNAGFPIASVGILRLPVAGELDAAVWKPRPHNPERAAAALQRAGGIARMVDALGAAAIPLQPTYDHHCQRCDFFQHGATDLTRGCPGDAVVVAKRATPPAHLTALIA